MKARGGATLTCQEVVELVSDLFEGYLPPEERALLEQHLLICPPCTLHVEQMKTTVEATGRLRAAEASAQVPAPVLDLFRRWQSK
jgi:anti-sigma factor RsiW